MKTFKYLLAGTMFFTFAFSNAQSAVLNLGAPKWGAPVTTERYYYIPDIETYYDIPSHEYIYVRQGNWVRARALPEAHRNYDLYGGRKVVITDYRGNAPYTFYNVHRVKYVKAYRPAPKKIWVRNPGRGHAYGHEHGNGNGHGNGHGHGHHKHD